MSSPSTTSHTTSNRPVVEHRHTPLSTCGVSVAVCPTGMRSAQRRRPARGDAEDARGLCPRSRPRSHPVWSELLQASWGSRSGGGWLLPAGMKAEPGPCPIFASGKCYLIARKITRRTWVVSGREALRRHLWSQMTQG